MKRKDRSSSSAKEERKTKKTKKISEVEEIQQASKLDFSSSDKLFSSLVAPTTSEAFFSDYWEKKPLLIQREDTSFYGPLFTKEDLEEILKKEELNFAEDLNVVRYEDGDKLYLNGNPDEHATWSQVSKDIKERNATVQFHQPQRFKDILWKLNAYLESLFGCLVGANVYITPPGSQGLAPHHDDVEIFILQLEGKKQWKLYKPPTELAQEYSPDLDQDSIGEPTHEFELQPGDMVYFPRGTVHQATTPKGGSHSTHLTISTYQQNGWGNLLSHVVTDAVEKALENDVEFRRGLPINYNSYMGLGMKTDEKLKPKQEDFANKMKLLLSKLVDHLDVHQTVDKIAADFMANRLPPIEQKEDALKEDDGDAEKAPTEDSEVKFLYPEHVRVSVGNMPEMIPIGALDDEDDGEGTAEGSSAEDEEGKDTDDSEDESMESDEDEEEKATKSKKKTKAKQKATGKKSKAEITKKKKKQEESDDDEEEEEDENESSEEEEAKKAKKKKPGKKEKTKKGKSKKTKKEESEEDEEMESEDEKPKKKSKGKKDADASKKKKGKKGKKSESEDDDDDDESFELGDDDTEEDSDDESDDDDEESEGPWVFVHHSLNNDPSQHMIQTQQPSIVKFNLTFKDAVLYLYSKRHEYTAIKDLPLEKDDAQYLVTSLWSEGLLDIKD